MGTREVPLGINTTTGAVAIILALAVPANLTGLGINARLGVLAVGLVAFAAVVVDVSAVLISIGVAYLLFDGFVEGNHGDLVWHGRVDVIRLGVLCAAGAIGLLIGAFRKWRGRLGTSPGPTSSMPLVPRPRVSGESKSPATTSRAGTGSSD
jgi:hypothetical protein